MNELKPGSLKDKLVESKAAPIKAVLVDKKSAKAKSAADNPWSIEERTIVLKTFLDNHAPTTDDFKEMLPKLNNRSLEKVRDQWRKKIMKYIFGLYGADVAQVKQEGGRKKVKREGEQLTGRPRKASKKEEAG